MIQSFSTYSNRTVIKITSVSIWSVSGWRTGKNWTILDSLGAFFFARNSMPVTAWFSFLMKITAGFLTDIISQPLQFNFWFSHFSAGFYSYDIVSWPLMDLKPPELGKLQLVHTTTALVAKAATNTSNQFQLSAGFPQNIRSSTKPLCLVFKVLKGLSSKSPKSHLTFQVEHNDWR